jgi:hypothetical protein
MSLDVNAVHDRPSSLVLFAAIYVVRRDFFQEFVIELERKRFLHLDLPLVRYILEEHPTEQRANCILVEKMGQ